MCPTQNRAGDVFLYVRMAFGHDHRWEHGDILTETPDLDNCCDQLISIANENGGTDNITVIWFDVMRNAALRI